MIIEEIYTVKVLNLKKITRIEIKMNKAFDLMLSTKKTIIEINKSIPDQICTLVLGKSKFIINRSKFKITIEQQRKFADIIVF